MKIKDIKKWAEARIAAGDIIPVHVCSRGKHLHGCWNDMKTVCKNLADYDDSDIRIAQSIDDIPNRPYEGDIEDYDAVIQLMNVAGTILYIYYNNNEFPTNMELEKGNYGHDVLRWSYMGRDYACEGEFEVNEWGNLHHIFVAPTGKEFNICIAYN